MSDQVPRAPLPDLTVADKAVNAAWAAQAADLSKELGFEILWCPRGFEVPDGHGGIVHHGSPTAVRAFLAGRR